MKGRDGPEGAPGESGLEGYEGDRGEKGIVGPTGPQGQRVSCRKHFFLFLCFQNYHSVFRWYTSNAVFLFFTIFLKKCFD